VNVTPYAELTEQDRIDSIRQRLRAAEQHHLNLTVQGQVDEAVMAELGVPEEQRSQARAGIARALDMAASSVAALRALL
jgi:FixJ family two-component response regulator